jgi:hypothetical protein
VRRWKALHLRQAAEHPFDKEPSWGKILPGRFRLILVEHLDAPESNPVWLIWMALEEMTLSQAWKQHLRRCAIEHWYRFMRQQLYWTVPQLSTPK